MDTVTEKKKASVISTDIPEEDFYTHIAAKILGWNLGELQVQISRGYRTAIPVGTKVFYKQVGNGGGIFVCKTEIMFSITKHKGLNNPIEQSRINSTLIKNSKSVPLSSVKPIEKPAD